MKTGTEQRKEEGERFVRYFGPLLDALRALGGSGTPDEVVERIALDLKLSDEIQNETLPSGELRLPSWSLITVCVTIGVAGLIGAYWKPWAAVSAIISVVCVTAATIVQLRDPLSLRIETRQHAGTLGYLAALYWAFVIGVALPVIGLYLRARSSSRNPPTKLSNSR